MYVSPVCGVLARLIGWIDVSCFGRSRSRDLNGHALAFSHREVIDILSRLDDHDTARVDAYNHIPAHLRLRRCDELASPGAQRALVMTQRQHQVVMPRARR